MKWEKMAEPLLFGFQVFRKSWPEDRYIMQENGETRMFSNEHPEGIHLGLIQVDWMDAEDADDWMATGPAGA